MEMYNVLYIYIYSFLIVFAHFELATNDLKIINMYTYIPIYCRQAIVVVYTCGFPH